MGKYFARGQEALPIEPSVGKDLGPAFAGASMRPSMWMACEQANHIEDFLTLGAQKQKGRRSYFPVSFVLDFSFQELLNEGWDGIVNPQAG